MSKTYKAVIYKQKEGHKHVYDCELERIDDAFMYYEQFEKEN